MHALMLNFVIGSMEPSRLQARNDRFQYVPDLKGKF
jgi:hypothetical protein